MRMMKIWKGMLGVVLLLCTLLCVTNITAAADDSTHSHPICGATHKDIGDHKGTCDAVTWTAWNGTSDIQYDSESNTAYVYLTGNVEWTDVFTLEEKTLYLCLNGYSITRTTDSDSSNLYDSVIHIHKKAQLVLCDCKGSGKITHATGKGGRGIRIGTSSSGGTFTMFGGEISGNRVTNEVGDGAGVEMQRSTFTMYGGKITDNHVINGLNNNGGGVYANTGGTFTMYGGEISNNTSACDGGGVMSAGTNINLYGGTISNNAAVERGGGVFTNMPLTMTDNVTITDNKAESGGGIFVYNESVTIEGVTISNNTATYGGGVYVVNDYRSIKTLTISDSAMISGNTAATSGGGIYVESGKNTSNWNKGQAILIISGGNIKNNTTNGNGGGIYVGERSLLTITGGNVTGNTATGNGGGVYYKGESEKFNISGNVNVSGNKKGSTANDIYLPSGQIIKITGKLTNTTPIGVTTEVVPDSSAYVQIASGNVKYATSDKFQYENNSATISVVGSGNTAIFVACVHNWGTDWKTDSDSHWHECSICKAKSAEAVHSGGTATCTEKATCEECGLPYGNALGHDFTGGTWQSDANNHWKQCSRCTVTDAKSDHKWNNNEVTKNPTCIAAGVRTFTCTECSATKEETIDALGHDFTGAWQKDDNNHWKKCSRCDVTASETEHNWNTGDVITEATCTADGRKTYTCTDCLATKSETLSATGHTLTHYETKAPTCTEKGWNAYDTCACGYTTYVEIAALDHDFTGTWQKDSDNHWKKCSRCDAVDPDTKSAHVWEVKFTVDPTCTAMGLETYACTTCYAAKTKTIASKGHNTTRHNAKAATCTDIGWNAYIDCSDCDYTTRVEIPALGHDFDDIWQKDDNNHWKKCSRCDVETRKTEHNWNTGNVITEATCTADGRKTYTCTDCFATKSETLSATGHTLTHYEAKAPTCTENGWNAYDTCACGYTTYVEIVALDHDFTGAWQKDDNNHWKKCSRCDVTASETEHNWNTGDVITEATCTADGRKTYTCTDCLATKSETLSATGHTLTHYEAKVPTCTENGWDAYDTCACGYTTYVEIAALDHDFTGTWQKDADKHWKKCSRCDSVTEEYAHKWNDGKITTEPTCTATGRKDFTCTICLATKSETLSSLGHRITYHDAKAATCTEIGWNAYVDCPDCGYTTYVEMAALGHDFTDTWQKDGDKHWKKCSRCDSIDEESTHTWNKGEVTLQPTCTVAGRTTYTCADCLATKTETIEPNGHKLTNHSAKAATCTEIGWNAYVDCSDCNYNTRVEIDALGHDFTGTWQKDESNHWKICSRCNISDTKSAHKWNNGEITTEPTCTATGRKTYICTDCLAAKTETLNALGHKTTHHDAKAVTCENFGWKDYVDCSECDYTTYVELPALGHDKVTHKAKAETCTEIGWKAYETCSRCSYTTYEEIPAIGHDEVSHDGKAATCTEDGWKPYVTCNRCSYTTYEKINAIGHDEISHEAKAATCTEPGWKAYTTCNRCDFTTYEEIGALGHDFTGGTWQTNAEQHWKKCSRCNVTDKKAQHTGGTATCIDSAVCAICSKAYGVTDPENHVGGTEIRDMVEPTDEKTGHTGNSYCKDCNTKLSDGTIIPVISNLSIDKKSDLSTAVDAMEKFLSDHNSNYTDDQKELLVDSINAIKSALKSIENAEEAVKRAEAMPAADKAQPDDKAAIDAYEAAKKAYDDLSADEKRMAGEHIKDALDAMLKALTAYDVNYGDGSVWAENDSNNGLTFTVNGYHKKFSGILINGSILDPKYYEIATGSTIVTLKSEYLQTLPAGKYTLLVQYTDGSTDGEDTFTITKGEPTAPSDTADTSTPKAVNTIKLTVWISIALVCAGILIILLLLFFKKRKQEKEEE